MADSRTSPNLDRPQIIRVAVGSKNPCKIEAVRKAFREILDRGANDGNSDNVTASSRSVVKLEISAFDVPSGVPDQPFGDPETRQGAMNRAQAAFNAAIEAAGDDFSQYPDFAVGLEGGLEKHLYKPQQLSTNGVGGDGMQQTEELWCMAWMAILGSNSALCTLGKAAESNFVPATQNYSCNKNCDQNGREKDRKFTWGYAKTAAFLLPPALCDLVLHKNMELGHADDMVFRRVNSKHGSGTVGKLTDGQIDRMDYYVHSLKMALIPWIRPELYLR
mmetsp:Transcript_32183/g.66205  ORF Transcript_32183/g.66205 Transcript_32183/m.66205 type:complete len:276 (-) Transcript_32183:15-842(-)